MSRHARSVWDTDVIPRVDSARPNAGPRHARPPAPRPKSASRRVLTGVRTLAALTAVAVLAGTGSVWAGYRNATAGITTSRALFGGPASTGGDQNILIMGLDSRLDQNGQPLPPEIYDALHAGDETSGGYNANVLIVLHIPAGDGPMVAISIPRDDYVHLAGCPTPSCMGKVKQGYAFAYERALEEFGSQNGDGEDSDDGTGTHTLAQEQTAREAGRKAEIETVRSLLGIPIDHFIEVTLVAFFQIAQVIQPITVCLNADTSDPYYSGADFTQGIQQIDAAQAMAFVRQRRDVNNDLFTDMDRTRRQQAFIASLVSALRHGRALSSPTTMRKLLDVVHQNVAVDAGFDLNNFVQNASAYTDRSLSLYTLPIAEFATDDVGEDVNLVDVATIRDIVSSLISNGSPPAAAPVEPPMLDVVNAGNETGLAAAVIDHFATRGFRAGEASSAESLAEASSIEYGSGANDSAHTLATKLGLTASASASLAPNTVRLTLGTNFPAAEYLTAPTDTGTSSETTSSETAAPGTDVPTVAATATGSAAPVPTDLSRMSGTDIPCVR